MSASTFPSQGSESAMFNAPSLERQPVLLSGREVVLRSDYFDTRLQKLDLILDVVF